MAVHLRGRGRRRLPAVRRGSGRRGRRGRLRAARPRAEGRVRAPGRRGVLRRPAVDPPVLHRAAVRAVRLHRGDLLARERHLVHADDLHLLRRPRLDPHRRRRCGRVLHHAQGAAQRERRPGGYRRDSRPGRSRRDEAPGRGHRVVRDVRPQGRRRARLRIRAPGNGLRLRGQQDLPADRLGPRPAGRRRPQVRRQDLRLPVGLGGAGELPGHRVRDRRRRRVRRSPPEGHGVREGGPHRPQPRRNDASEE